MADAALPRSRARVLALVLVLAAIAPYLQSLTFGYVLDDTYAIRGNDSLRGWSSLWQVWLQQFGGDGGPFTGLYRPVTMTLFAVVFNSGAKWPLWFHVMALLLHAVAALLVWRLLREALSDWPAFIAALWFAVHPVHVEAVANITNTSEVLVAVWSLWLAVFLIRRARCEQPLQWSTATIAGLLYLAAMLSKESGAMAGPVAIIAAWGWQRDVTPTMAWMIRRWWRVGVLFAGAAILVAIARALVLGGPVTGQSIAALGLTGMTTAERVLAMTSLIPKVVRLLVWPGGVNPHYGPSTFSEQRALFVVLGLLMLTIILGAAFRLARRGDRRALAGAAIAIVAFLPASNLLVATGQVLAERTLYLPSAGAAMLLGVAVERALRPASFKWTRSATAAAIGVILLWAGVRTAVWTGHWRNHDRLFARMIAADPRGYAGYWLSGIEATRQKRPDEGLTLFEKAYALERRDRGLLLDLGAALTNDGQFERAQRIYREGLLLAPDDSTLQARLRALPRR